MLLALMRLKGGRLHGLINLIIFMPLLRATLRLNGREIWRWSVAMLVLLGLEFRKGWGLFHLDLREPRPLRILMMPFGLKGMERRGWLHSGLVVLGVGRRERRGTLGLGCRRGLLHLGWIGVMPLRVLLRQLRTGRG
jgi:hypothetical protein